MYSLVLMRLSTKLGSIALTPWLRSVHTTIPSWWGSLKVGNTVENIQWRKVKQMQNSNKIVEKNLWIKWRVCVKWSWLGSLKGADTLPFIVCELWINLLQQMGRKIANLSFQGPAKDGSVLAYFNVWERNRNLFLLISCFQTQTRVYLIFNFIFWDKNKDIFLFNFMFQDKIKNIFLFLISYISRWKPELIYFLISYLETRTRIS